LGGALALLLAALYVPWASSLLRFAPLPAHELAGAVALGLLSVLWLEGIKAWRPSRAAPSP
jgi:Ca2+-transporting ATPase